MRLPMRMLGISPGFYTRVSSVSADAERLTCHLHGHREAGRDCVFDVVVHL